MESNYKLKIRKMRNRMVMSLIMLTFVAFIYGLAVGHYKIFPFDQLRSLKVRYLDDAKSTNAKALVEAKDKSFTETVLLPLEYHDVKLSPGPARGSIEVYRNSVLLVDGSKDFQMFDISSEVFTPLDYPDLPSDIFNVGINNDVELRIYDIMVSDHRDRKYVFVSSEAYSKIKNHTALTISLIEVDENLNPIGNTWRPVFTGSPIEITRNVPNAGGGRMARIDDDHILLTTGDYALDGMTTAVEGPMPAQDDASTLGKIIRVNIADGTYEIVSKGHRNPQGLLVGQDGRIYATEHGPKGGDELNVIANGKNYGWPLVSYGVDYGTYQFPHTGEVGRHDGYETPLFSWVPSVAISAVAEIEDFHPRWNGDLLIGSLKARSLYRARLHEGLVSYVEPIWIGGRVRDLDVAKGKIFVWLDAQILRIVEVAESALDSKAVAGLVGLDPSLAQCLGCHHLGRTNSSHPAPSLAGILSRQIGSDPGFERYSNALKGREDKWSEDKLMAFIKAPETFAPGTVMPALEGLNDAEIRRIVDKLGEL